MAMALRVRRSTVVDWSNLSSDVLEQISKRLAIEDFIRFQAVCKSWRLSLKQRPYLHNPPDQLPWLAIPDYTSSICKFYNLKEDRFHHIYLPELHDAVCIGSSHGWMIVVDRSLNVFLLNPLTRSRIELPPISTCSEILSIFPPLYENVNSETYYRWRSFSLATHVVWETEDEVWEDDRSLYTAERMQPVFFKKVILSGNPSLTGDYIVMAICGSYERLAFCRQGDEKWTFIKDGYYLQNFYRDLVYWKQKIYVLHVSMRLCVCDLGGKVSEVSTPELQIVVNELDSFRLPYGHGIPAAYLLISEEQLLLICKQPRHGYKLDEFTVYMFNEENRNWVPYRNLESRMLFLGSNFSLSLGADKFQEWKGNHIYFAPDQLVGEGVASISGSILLSGAMGCYGLKTCRIEPLESFGLRQSGLKLFHARLIEFSICNLFNSNCQP